MVRVLLVDDHTVVRRGLRKILESNPQITVVGEIGDGAQAVSMAETLHPDVVLMDISLPGLNGVEATRQIVAQAPDSKVLMLSMHADEPYVRQSLAAGAKGYLLKDADDQDLVEAVTAVHRGETRFSATLARATTIDGDPVPDVLSPREREVLSLICSGRTNREAAEVLGLSVNTVETHRKHIIDKLDLHSTAELVRYAIRHGLAV
ncbi:MAG TPA: response regulator transcription factor [Candidatus Binatia bacterium]|nr:response regulator transcription factor [Candidatus Binatia bacterium]